MKLFKWISVFLVIVIVAVALFVWQTLRSLEVTELSDDVFVLSGFGSNVTVVKTDAGAVVIDSMATGFQGARISDKAKALTGRKVVLLINTHHHPDHIYGNSGFDKNIRVIASRKTGDYLNRCSARMNSRVQGFPSDLIDSDQTLKIGNKTLKLSLPGPGHTGGDLIIRIVEDDVLVMGDLFSNHFYPNIDLESGGSLIKWAAALDRLKTEPAKIVIPGHGQPSDMAGLAEFQNFIIELSEKVGRAHSAGLNLEQTLGDVSLEFDQGYKPAGIPLIFRIDRDFVVKRAWQEADKSFKQNSCSG